MEEINSFFSNVFGAIIFCIALGLLFLLGEMEQDIVNELTKQSISMTFYQR